MIGRLDGTNRSALMRMAAALAHRGPDGQEVWESRGDERGWGAMLAYRRLGGPGGGGSWAWGDSAAGGAHVLDGRIHGVARGAAGLGSVAGGAAALGSGGAPTTASLLRALSPGAPPHGLRGAFALAAWDGGERRLLLARDPLGLKPLYLARNPDRGGSWSVAFASEVRALLRSGLLGAPRLDPDAVRSVVWNGFVVGPTTAVLGVELLPAGRRLQFGVYGAAEQADTPAFPAQDAEATDEGDLAAALEESVELHLRGPTRPAIFLSSGVDSSVVAHLAQRVSDGPVATFTLSFEEGDFDEGPRAAAIARAIGTHHQEVVLSEDAFVSHLHEAIDRLDQPSFDGLNAYFLSRAVREAGFSTTLVGSGGDELFGGYPTFRALPTLHRWGRRMRWVPGEVLEAVGRMSTSHLRRATAAVPPQTRWSKLPDLLAAGGELERLYQLAYALFLPDFQRELLADAVASPLPFGLPEAMRERLATELEGRSPLSSVAVLEQRIFLGERLSRDNDVASQAVSVEQRAPLVDLRVVDVASRLPDAQRFEPLGRKDLLRRVGLAGLDPALFERPKVGFVLPYDRWIRQKLRGPMDELLRDPAAATRAGLRPEAVQRLWRAFLEGAPGVYWSRVWAIYVLMRWTSAHGVRLDSAGMERPPR